MPVERFVSSLRVTPIAFLAVLLIAVALVVILPAHAQAAGEATPVAENPELESRVQSLSRNLRCLVCQNESVAESRAPLAVDLRAQVREQLGSGKSESEVIDFMVSRYGDFVLYRPPFKATTALLWLGPIVLLVGGLGWLLLRLRSREQEAVTHLTEDERRRARALLEGAPADSKEQRS